MGRGTGHGEHAQAATRTVAALEPLLPYQEGVKIVAAIKIPEEATLETIEAIREMLIGHGFPEVDYERRTINFEMWASDSGPSPLNELIVAAAAREAEKRGLEIPELSEIVAAAVGVSERWQDVEDELRSYGWLVPEVEYRIPDDEN